MKRFAALYAELDMTTATSLKVAALADYFAAAPPQDAAWAVVFLTGGKLKRVVSTTLLHELAVDASGYPEGLVGACYDQVGDQAETIALLVDADGPDESDVPLVRTVSVDE